jgi:hypothetical protein
MESHLVRKAVASGLSKVVAVNPANGPAASLPLAPPAGHGEAAQNCWLSTCRTILHDIVMRAFAKRGTRKRGDAFRPVSGIPIIPLDPPMWRPPVWHTREPKER